jgi:hypothetical protein
MNLSSKPCQCRNTDYWVDDILGNQWSISRCIDSDNNDNIDVDVPEQLPDEGYSRNAYWPLN